MINMKSNELKGNLILLLTALIWGCAFVAQSVSMDYVGPFTFQCTRSLLGAAVLVPVFLTIDKKKKADGTYILPNSSQKRIQNIAGLICGVIMTIAGNLQQLGMQYTTAGKAGFITAMYILIVPILGLFMKKKVSARLWGCVGIAMIGLYLLSMNGGFSSITKGDILVLLCAVAFAFHILAVDHFIDFVDGVRLSSMQFLVCGVLSGVLMLIYETPTTEGLMGAALPIAYAGIMSCGIAYTLQIIGQKGVKATASALILSLESVFGVVGSALFLGERMSLREYVGCAIVFLAVILSQIDFISIIKNKILKRKTEKQD